MHGLVDGSRCMYRGAIITGLGCVIKEKEKTKAKSRECNMLEMIYWGKIGSVSSYFIVYKYKEKYLNKTEDYPQ